LSVEDDVAISGDGRLSTIIDGAGFRGVFSILPAVIADISVVTIPNGNAYTGGGGVFNLMRYGSSETIWLPDGTQSIFGFLTVSRNCPN
jgi:hypothetical protein